MKYTTEEKMLIAANRPEIEIESIEFSYAYENSGDEAPLDELCFMTEEAQDLYFTDCVEGMYATFNFRDTGAKYSQKYVIFNGFAQIYDSLSDEIADYQCDVVPTIIYQATADDDGRFSVSVPIFIRKVNDDEDDGQLIKKLSENEALFQFADVVVGNQFACESLKNVSGVIAELVEKKDISRICASYELTTNYVADGEELT